MATGTGRPGSATPGAAVTAGLPPRDFTTGALQGGAPETPPPDLPTARANLAAARQELSIELDHLEASARSALDVKARARENKVKLAAGAGGLAFLAVGGPRRVARRVRWFVTGREERPKGLLPKDIDQLLDRIGENNDVVRRSLEYDFAQYLKKAHPKPKSFIRTSIEFAAQGALAGGVSRAVARAVDMAMRPPAQRYDEALRDVTSRGAADAAGGDLGGKPGATPPSSTPPSSRRP